ncbi:MAG TPA: cytochrome c [Steroidobacteraceae bacterium]|nr:cytochrome c [Steroidobacteraceae bacterium]
MRGTLWGVASAALSLMTIPAWGQDAATAGQLPAGNGRAIAAGKCVVCHDAGPLVYPGYTREGWQKVIGRMTKLGATVTPEQIPALTDYLARAFPERPSDASTLSRGRSGSTRQASRTRAPTGWWQTLPATSASWIPRPE